MIETEIQNDYQWINLWAHMSTLNSLANMQGALELDDQPYWSTQEDLDRLLKYWRNHRWPSKES